MEKNCEYCKHIQGRGLPLPGDDIDTDRIIPARFMKCVTFEGLGRFAFYDERFNEDGSLKKHPFNNHKYDNHEIMLVNRNFGCGSSREHAPQSLMDFGVRALIGESFAEIFAGNCTAMGIPAVTVSHTDILGIMALVDTKPETVISIDLENKSIALGEVVFTLSIPDSYRHDLITGTWDTTASLLDNTDEIIELTETLPYMKAFQVAG